MVQVGEKRRTMESRVLPIHPPGVFWKSWYRLVVVPLSLEHDEGIVIDPKTPYIELHHFLTENTQAPRQGFAFNTLNPFQLGFISALFFVAPEDSDYTVQGYQNRSGLWVSSFIQRNEKPEGQITIYYSSPEEIILKPPQQLPVLFPGD